MPEGCRYIEHIPEVPKKEVPKMEEIKKSGHEADHKPKIGSGLKSKEVE